MGLHLKILGLKGGNKSQLVLCNILSNDFRIKSVLRQ